MTELTKIESQKHKYDIRFQVWSELLKVAIPDSRFHFDFKEFIADFKGSKDATDLFLQSPLFQGSQYNLQNLIFITPDNCLELLRYELLCLGIPYLITTYGIRRGFFIIDPAQIAESDYRYASTLDGMEKLGIHYSLSELKSLNSHVSVMITGTGAINDKGIRFGKGHGFFDLEWAMLLSIKMIDPTTTKCIAFIHDCQLLTGVELKPEVFDTVCDLIITNSKVIHIENADKPLGGVLWDLLESNMMDDIEPLKELKQLIDSNQL